MHDRKVTFAFPFPHGSEGANLVRIAQEVCKSRGLVGKEAKLGPHATIIPPFYCTEREMTAMAILSRHLWLWSGREIPVTVTGFGIFGPAKPEEGIGALYLAIDVPEEYRKYVEKHKINWPFTFVHGPARSSASDRVWIPHLHVIEGEKLHEKAVPELPALNEYVRKRVVLCGEPLLFVEKTSGAIKWWEQVLV